MVALEQVLTRSVEPADFDRFARMWPRLSGRTVYRRFHSPVTRIPSATAHRLVEVDHALRDAVVAVVDDEVVGVARYERTRSDPSEAEFAVVVQDDWQGVGLGGRLVDEVLALASARGVTTLVASVLADNEPMLRLLRRRAPGVRLRLDHAVYEVAVPLRALRNYAAA